jgi:hypothetical protein
VVDFEAPVTEDLDTPPPVEGQAIQGRVTDFEGVPLVGVRVEAAATGGGDLDLLPVLSDGDGCFRLEGLADGHYDLRFSLGQVRARVLRVPAGTEDLKARLARPQGLLLVVKTSQGRPPPGVLHVALDRHGPEGPVREHTGRHLAKRLLLWSLRPGTYSLTAWGGPYLPVRAHGIEVEAGAPAPEVPVLLDVEGGRLLGTLADANGAPVADALVAWRPLDGEGPWSLRDRSLETDAQGRFTVQGLPVGRVRVIAGPPSGPFASAEVVIAEGALVEVDLRLPG